MPLINYRYNPFQDVLNPVTVSNEEHIVPSASPFTIQLCEAPKKDAPSTISLKIDGVTAEEVAAYPAAGQYWPDYSTNADGNPQWNTGTILFNSADAGKNVLVTYKATGTVVWADTINTYLFRQSGTIIAPQWARSAILSGCGGGGGGGGFGGGGGAGSRGSAGGVTSFGSLLSLGGGEGGGGRGTAHGNMEAGAGGETFSGLVPSKSGRYLDKIFSAEGAAIDYVYRAGAGGSGPFGMGGNGAPGATPSGWGAGGAGGLRSNWGGGGGGAGGACIERRVGIVGGQKYIITIGEGGGGGNGGGYANASGGWGSSGLLIIKWGG